MESLNDHGKIVGKKSIIKWNGTAHNSWLIYLLTCILILSISHKQHYSSVECYPIMNPNNIDAAQSGFDFQRTLVKRDLNEAETLNVSSTNLPTRPCISSHDCKWSPSTVLNDNLTQLAKCIEGLCKFESINLFNQTANNTKGTTGPSLHMLPILIFMGIMFIGMCVALNLFSRARFKNNRSIFSNPQILKMKSNGKKGKRRRRRRGGQLANMMSEETGHGINESSTEDDEQDEEEQTGNNKFVEISLDQLTSSKITIS